MHEHDMMGGAEGETSPFSDALEKKTTNGDDEGKGELRHVAWGSTSRPGQSCPSSLHADTAPRQKIQVVFFLLV